MYLVIERTVVLAVLRYVDHALVTAVERRVENPALRGCAALSLDLAENLIPPFFRGAFHPFKRPAGNLRLQILPRLFYADERNAVAKFQDLPAVPRGNG